MQLKFSQAKIYVQKTPIISMRTRAIFITTVKTEHLNFKGIPKTRLDQRNWIGRSLLASLYFKLHQFCKSIKKSYFKVFVASPD